MRAIYIYAGAGASHQNAQIMKGVFETALRPHGFDIRCLDEHETADGAWRRDAALVIFGGGEFTKVKNAIGNRGVTAVREYVRCGGRYFGSCMGGYAGVGEIEFFGADDMKTNTGFGFTRTIARGPLPITPAGFDGSSRSAAIATFRHNATGILFPALYWGGPHFPAHDASARPIMTLSSVSGERPVVMGLDVPFGNGRAVLTGCHVEAFTPAIIREWTGKFLASPEDNQRLEQEMAAFSDGQFMIGLASVLDDLKLVPGHSFLRQVLTPVREYAPIVAIA